MAPESEKAFIHAHRDAIVRFWERVRSRILDWKSKYEWPPGIPLETALNRRTDIEGILKNELAASGGLSKRAFDSVIRWGFGTGSECSEEEIKRATQHAFECLRRGRIADAARALKFPKIGISRISKILALSDQHEFGIYDSRSAQGLSDLIDSTGRRIIPIPPGRVVAGDHLTKDEYCIAFEKYTSVLRELRRLAGQDDLLRANFPRIADLEIAFFARSKIGEVASQSRLRQTLKVKARAEHNRELLKSLREVGRPGMAERPTFDQVYALLCGKGPGLAISSRGTHYRLEGRDGKILAFPKSGRVTIHADCWGEDRTCQATRAGGIYNGPYSIYDWYLSFRSAVEMRTYTAVVEQCPDTGLYVGYVPGFPGAHTQGETLDELNKNLLEVIEMLLEDGEPELEALYIGTQTVTVG